MAQITLTLFLVLLSQLAGVPGVPLESQAAVVTSPRIVGGTDAPDGIATHMMGLVFGDWQSVRSFMCGGAIVSVKHVLTAAHCIEALLDWHGNILSSVLGVYGSNRWDSTEMNVKFSGYKNHEGWNPITIKFDIGIYYIHKNDIIIISYKVAPISLGLSHVGGGVECYITGWGRLWDRGPIPAVLQHIDVTTLDNQTCTDSVADAIGNLWAPPIDYNIEICTHHPKGIGFGACHGDSGSGVVCKINYGQRVLVGLISWGIMPCARGAPDMSARISGFKDWLKLHLI